MSSYSDDPNALSVSRLQSILNSNTAFVVRVDLQGNFTYINQAMLDCYRWQFPTLEDAIGTSSLGTIVPEDRPKAEEAVVWCLQNPDQPTQRYIRKPTEDGGSFWALWEFVALTNPDGDIQEIQCIGFDVTEIKKAEEARDRSEKRYRLIADNSTDLIELYDASGQLIYISPSCLNLLGYTEAELYSIQQETLVHPDDREMVMHRFERALSGEPLPDSDSDNVTYRAKTKSGEFIWLDTSMSPIQDDDGTVTQVLATSRDVSARVAIEAELSASEIYLKSILNASNTFILRTDVEGNYTYVNEVMFNAFSWMYDSPEAMIGEPSMDTVIPEDHDKVIQLVETCFEHPNTPFTTEFRKPTQDGGYFWVLWEFTVLLDDPAHPENGEIQCVGIDITARKQAEQQRFQLTLERERVDILLRFIRNVSHEFRTPLSVINSHAHVMSRLDTEAKRQQKLGVIYEQGEIISNLLNTMLTMAEVEGAYLLNYTDVHIDNMLSMLCSKMQIQQNKTIHLQTAIANTLPVIQGDHDKLNIALQQLLENAYRFTPDEGDIFVEATADANQVYIKIVDSGVGINEDDLPNIFNSFWRKDEAHTTHGLGLGLPLAKQIIERHSGRITITSQENAGTTVAIQLPITPTTGTL